MRSYMEVGTRLSPAGLREVCTLCLATNKLIGQSREDNCLCILLVNII